MHAMMSRLLPAALLLVLGTLSRLNASEDADGPRAVNVGEAESSSHDQLASRTGGGGLRLIESQSAIRIDRDEVPVVVYNKRSPPVPRGIDPIYRRSGFLHPVASPRGRVVTATFPVDHAHQHGIFCAWVNTTYGDRSVDFWNLAGRTGRVLHQRVVSTFADDTATGFEVDLIHRAEEEPVVDVLRERWKVSVYPTDGSYHCFDLDLTQHALTDTPLTINQYHYGGMALRGPVRWLEKPARKKPADEAAVREPSFFLNSQGSARREGNHEQARWVALSGLIDGQPVSIAVLCHAQNFRAPQAARLHPTKPYFCFAPCVDGSFTIDGEHPYRVRYRYLITDGEPDPGWLDQQWDAWCGP